MRIAHLSDPHVPSNTPLRLRDFLFDKRLTGYLNLRLNRGLKHDPKLLLTLINDLAKQSVDHLVITGDLTNLSLENEFSAFCRLLAPLKMPASNISIIPGNHDRYTAAAERLQIFEHSVRAYLTKDDSETEQIFPFVKLRGPLAILGLSTAVARPPFVAAGEIGSTQLAALRRLLGNPNLQGRTLLVLTHHPVVMLSNGAKRYFQGLRDAKELIEACKVQSPVLFLHGHLHRRLALDIGSGQLCVGAPSASLNDPRPGRMAGYNLYEFDSLGGLSSIRTRSIDPLTMEVRQDSLEVEKTNLQKQNLSKLLDSQKG